MSTSCKDGTHTPVQLILASIPRTLLLQRHTGTVLTQCNISVSNSSSNLHSHIFYNVPVSGLVAGRAVGHRRHPSLSTLSHTDRGQWDLCIHSYNVFNHTYSIPVHAHRLDPPDGGKIASADESLASTPVTSSCPEDIFVIPVKNRLSFNEMWWRLLTLTQGCVWCLTNQLLFLIPSWDGIQNQSNGYLMDTENYSHPF